MQIFNKIMPLKSFLLEKRTAGISIGLVPTMGALHKGHLSLIKKSLASCDLTVVSIFVNPTQFNKEEDFNNYPVTLEADKALLIKEGIDILFMPDAKEMYPDRSKIKLHFGQLDTVLEGKFRLGHFSGVGLIVSKLFNIVSPDKAFFGQKDLQQVAVIKKLNSELTFGIDIITVPTVRDADGLALSSRNKRLTTDQRKLAPILYQILTETKSSLISGEDIQIVMKHARDKIAENNPEIELEYLEDISKHQEISLCIAAYFNEIRLIDNLFLFSR